MDAADTVGEPNKEPPIQEIKTFLPANLRYIHIYRARKMTADRRKRERYIYLANPPHGGAMNPLYCYQITFLQVKLSQILPSEPTLIKCASFSSRFSNASNTRAYCIDRSSVSNVNICVYFSGSPRTPGSQPAMTVPVTFS